MPKPIMSLKQFMIRAEILKLYRGFLRLGKFLNEPPTLSNTASSCGDSSTTLKSSETGLGLASSGKLVKRDMTPMRTEWNDWVRSEFRLRQVSTTDEEMTKALIGYGKRQLQEMERSIMLATNKNLPDQVQRPKIDSSTSCNHEKQST